MKPRDLFALSTAAAASMVFAVACEDDTLSAPGGAFGGDASIPSPGSGSDAAATNDDAGDAGGGEAGGGDAQATTEAGAGNLLVFDGVDDVIEVTLPKGDGGAPENAFTSEVWFRSVDTVAMLTEVWAASGGADRSLYIDQGKVCFYVYAPADKTLCTDAATFADNEWHHAAGTLGSVGGQILYVDGVLAKSDASVKTSAFNFENRFRAGYGHIGAYGSLTYLAGDLDEVRLWKVERTASEIAADYRRSVPSSAPGLLLYWKLDGSGSSTQATDSSPSQFHGTLVGFDATPPWGASNAF